MNIRYFIIFSLSLGILFTSCNNDDDNDILPQKEQNEVDDAALVKILNDYYFNENGVMTKFDEDDESDDDYTPLMQYATQDPSGYWYVVNPNVEATGDRVTSNTSDSILIQHTTYSFKATKDDDRAASYFLNTYSSSINTSGAPTWDPFFYYTPLTDDSDKEEFYTIEGFVNGIKNFNATNRAADATPPVKLQGVILIPSRLAYERDFNRLQIPYDVSFVVNFELYKIIPRNN